MSDERARGTIAYFSMEIALEDTIPTYSGGLGVLAGDYLRSAADADLDAVAITLVYHGGYFHQRLDEEGRQHEEPVEWSPEDTLERLPQRVEVAIEGRTVHVAAWRYVVRGLEGGTLPVVLLDTCLAENDPVGRSITDRLYGGDVAMRLRQEIVLGIGGLAMLDELGYTIGVHHLNEGHAALVGVGLLERRAASDPPSHSDLERVRSEVVFTTHTPVPAGHDRFARDLVLRLLGAGRTQILDDLALFGGGELNMTLLALSCSRVANAVSRRHREVAQAMFPQFPLASMTNGVHVSTWVGPEIARVFDAHLPGWRTYNVTLRDAIGIPRDEIRAAHREAKRALFAEVGARTGLLLDPEVLTLGIARRATAYKRLDLLLSDEARLRELTARAGPMQVVYSGKAHPADRVGKETIARVTAAARRLGDAVRVTWIEDYSTQFARRLCAGADVWLNSPLRPYEASGTSGMKAALNGVPSLSILDGWWIEGHVEGVTGWAFGADTHAAGNDRADDAADAQALYERLETAVLPLYYGDPEGFATVMRFAIALNGSFFNTERMLEEYVRSAYFPAGLARQDPRTARGSGGTLSAPT